MVRFQHNKLTFIDKMNIIKDFAFGYYLTAKKYAKVELGFSEFYSFIWSMVFLFQVLLFQGVLIPLIYNYRFGIVLIFIVPHILLNRLILRKLEPHFILMFKEFRLQKDSLTNSKLLIRKFILGSLMLFIILFALLGLAVLITT